MCNTPGVEHHYATEIYLCSLHTFYHLRCYLREIRFNFSEESKDLKKLELFNNYPKPFISI